VEAMGRINFGKNLIDRKGITDSVTFNGTTLTNWKVYNLPMDRKFIYNLRSTGRTVNKPGIFYKGNFMITRAAGVVPGDTYVDLSNYTKGLVWVNGRNLGRYWNIGPQTRLFCPASWLREGLNEIIVFDLHQLEGKVVSGKKTMN
jgi:beta-galactosidase